MQLPEHVPEAVRPALIEVSSGIALLGFAAHGRLPSNDPNSNRSIARPAQFNEHYAGN